MSRESSTSSYSSDRSAGGSSRRHDVAVQFYSPGNGHWGTTVSDRSTREGQLFHVRSDTLRDSDRFYYHEREGPIMTQSTYGRSVVGRLSSRERGRVESAIRDYASVDAHIPRLSRGQNCQTFTTGVLGRLEDERLISRGHQEFFSQYHHRPAKEIGTALEERGRHWYRKPDDPLQGPPDARFDATSTRAPTGRLDMGRFANLEPRAPRRGS